MVNFPSRIPNCDSDSPAFLDLFLSTNFSICSFMSFPPMRNYDYVIVSVFIDFPSNPKQDSPFNRIAYDCARTIHGRIILTSVLFLLLVNFVIECKVKLHSSPWFSAGSAATIVFKNDLFHCTNRTNFLNLK